MMKSLLSPKVRIASLILLLSQGTSAQAYQFVETDADGVTHIRAPFTHVDIENNTPSGKHVRVKAPFTDVDNQPDPYNPSVKAPFTKVTQDPATGDTTVKAPFTRVENPPGPNNALIKAPFTKVGEEQTNSKFPPRAPIRNTNLPADYTRPSTEYQPQY